MKDNKVLNRYFEIIDDSRCDVNVIHLLVNILKLVIISVICGIDELNKLLLEVIGNNTIV